MSAKNTALLQKLYADFAKGDLKAVLDACDDKIKFEIPGRSAIAGTYTKETFGSQLAAKLTALSAGTLKMDLHEVFASDRHGIVLITDSLMRDGKKVEYRTVHVWRFEGGEKPVAFYEYPRNLYQFDEVWG